MPAIGSIPDRPALVAGLLPVLAAGTLAWPPAALAGPLEDYVRRPDDSFSHRVSEDVNLAGVRVLKVRLVSQTWRGIPWQHWLVVFVPPEVGGHGKGVLVVEGGSNRDRVPDQDHEAAMVIGMTATLLKAPVALLLQVPNQPLFGDLKEDDLIAHSFDRYLDGGDNDWPLLLPMVKSATSAMDALQEMGEAGSLRTVAGRPVEVDEFVVTGASKRGWTSWLTAAVDRRVCALAPMVIDVLNMPEQMQQQRKSYGEYSRKLRPYVERDILGRFESPRGAELCRIVDPYSYRERILQPKLLLLGSNDPYWTVDASRLYFPELAGPKAIFCLPNAGHNLGVAALPTLNNFLLSVVAGKAFPELRTEAIDGAVRVNWRGQAQPTVWRARSPDRDFRKATWEAEQLPAGSAAVMRISRPADGWAACFLSVLFPGLGDGAPPFSLSTPVQVVPEGFPHP